MIIGLFVASAVLLFGWWLSARRAAEPVLPLRLFRNLVFTIASAISLAAGFAMFGALSFLPLFLQVVRGVSPTISGVYLLPMVLGLLVTSVGSGQLIARTGRYKVYPIVGTFLLAVALFLLSRLDEYTATWVMNLYFFLLGFSLGLILQVLVIAVQNSVDYADLGTATAGVTFFRSIGGAFGTSVFGAIFANQLARNLASALHGVTLPPGFSAAAIEGDRNLLRQLPGKSSTPSCTPTASRCTRCSSPPRRSPWSRSCSPGSCARSRCVPRPWGETVRNSASAADLGEGIGAAPTQRSSARRWSACSPGCQAPNCAGSATPGWPARPGST